MNKVENLSNDQLLKEITYHFAIIISCIESVYKVGNMNLDIKNVSGTKETLSMFLLISDKLQEIKAEIERRFLNEKQ